MTKIFYAIIILGIVTKSQLICAETIHYTGIAEIIDTVHTNDGMISTIRTFTESDTINYVVFSSGTHIDSINYSILNYGKRHPEAQPHMNYLYETKAPSKVQYLTDNVDSIVFAFKDTFDFVEYDHGVGGQTIVVNHSERIIGVARISTATAGVETTRAEKKSFEFFPNPTHGLLKIKPNASKATVIDNLGRINISQKLEPPNSIEFNSLDVSSLQAGCYTILLEDGIKKIAAKFIKF